MEKLYEKFTDYYSKIKDEKLKSLKEAMNFQEIYNTSYMALVVKKKGENYYQSEIKCPACGNHMIAPYLITTDSYSCSVCHNKIPRNTVKVVCPEDQVCFTRVVIKEDLIQLHSIYYAVRKDSTENYLEEDYLDFSFAKVMQHNVKDLTANQYTKFLQTLSQRHSQYHMTLHHLYLCEEEDLDEKRYFSGNCRKDLDSLNVFVTEKVKSKYSALDYLCSKRMNPDENGFNLYFPERDIALYCLLERQYPQIELLAKANFITPVTNLLHNYTESLEKMFVRNFKKGSKLSEICQFPKELYEKAKKNNLASINDFRIIINKYGITTERHLDSIENIATFGNTVLTRFKSLLKYYNIEELLNYIEQLDTFQAIETKDGILLLYDYIHMCEALHVIPIYKTRSLKRDHDVVARNYSVIANKVSDEKFNKAALKLVEYEYRGEKFQIISPKTQDELIEEGNQQRNCVGSYIKRVANGRTMVFFLRTIEEPTKSRVTIELDKNFNIVQAFRKGNSPISPEENKFLEKWRHELSKKEEVA